ncbi:GLUG motif-containing protein, partial [Acinetobacter higginsii]|uniref:GLUG motif-containing protein n=1 Tax=Acinetobacter higginsii TaxID=70347 RepID=UPI001F6109D7
VIELGSDLSSGKVNVSGTLDASAPNGGNGGQIKTSAAEVNINSGTNITTQRNSTSSLPPTTSGWELKAKNVDVDFFGGSVSSTTLGDALNKGNVTLNAMGTAEGQGNININDASGWNANTALTLTATKDINFNSDLDLSGDKAKLAMNYGTGSDYNLNNGAKINMSGSSPTLLINGSSYIVINDLGEEGDANINTLQGMNNNLTGNYALGSNIDASDTVNWNNGKGFEPIGQAVIDLSQFEIQSGTPFQGNFHGLGHTIEGLTIQDPIPNVERLSVNTFIPQGLFSVSSGVLRNIGLVNTQINAYVGVGALSGYHQNGSVKNAYSTGLIQGGIYVGGLIGIAGNPNQSDVNGKISNSYSNSRIVGGVITGGLVGGSTLPIDNSYATGDISLPNVTMSEEDEQNKGPNDFGGANIGGLVGFMKNGISNSYATGNIRSGMYINNNFHPELGIFGAGGLVGSLNLDGVTHNIDQSYATGNVSGKRSVGGLVGVTVVRSNSNQAQLYINNSFATGKVDGESAIGGLVGGNAANNLILGSYASGEVKGKNEVGGLIGFNLGKIGNSYASNLVIGESQVGGLIGYNIGTVENSYSNGAVTGVNHVGGLIGEHSLYGGEVTNSYWNTETSGQFTSAGGTGKTTAELQKILTFSAWDIADASDPNSTSTWVIDEDNATPWLRYIH